MIMRREKYVEEYFYRMWDVDDDDDHMMYGSREDIQSGLLNEHKKNRSSSRHILEELR